MSLHFLSLYVTWSAFLIAPFVNVAQAGAARFLFDSEMHEKLVDPRPRSLREVLAWIHVFVDGNIP